MLRQKFFWIILVTTLCVFPSEIIACRLGCLGCGLKRFLFMRPVPIISMGFYSQETHFVGPMTPPPGGVTPFFPNAPMGMVRGYSMYNYRVAAGTMAPMGWGVGAARMRIRYTPCMTGCAFGYRNPGF